MAATKTLKELRDRAKLLADMENSEFISEAEWNANINDACQQLYNMLVDVRGQEYYATTSTIAVVSGTTQYNLPSDFFFLLDFTLDDGSRYVHPRTFELKERAVLLTDGNGTLDNIRYRLQPLKVEFLPSPSASYTATLTYTPTFTELVSDGSTFDGINGFERWVEYTAAMTALAKEESDTAGLAGERARIEMQIEKLKGRRDAGNPPRIQDTKRDWAGEDWPGWDA